MLIPDAFKARLADLIGSLDAQKALDAMASEASVSLRLNPFKEVEGSVPVLRNATQLPWNPYGYILDERPVFTLDPLMHTGAYYVQDSSAMFVGWLFRRILEDFEDRPLCVLDLCAAPGGKTTDLAASMRQHCGDGFLLVANEVMRNRAGILLDNVSVWGDPNVAVTSVDPVAFASLQGCFDIILADVPCSGEGMFRKDERAIGQWSPDVVSLCASRQRRIVADVWPALKPGGVLLYSTCTFEPAENDDNLRWFASELGGECMEPDNPFGVRTTDAGQLLIPGEVWGEGQWAGALRKNGSADLCSLSPVSVREGLRRLRPLRTDVCKGLMKGSVLIPDPDWALSLDYDGDYPQWPVDRLTALNFLHRDSIVLKDAPLGYLVLTYMGLRLGFVKNLGKRCNNLHPQSRRIKMDVV